MLQQLKDSNEQVYSLSCRAKRNIQLLPFITDVRLAGKRLKICHPNLIWNVLEVAAFFASLRMTNKHCWLGASTLQLFKSSTDHAGAEF